MKQWIKWICVNSLFAACMYMALFEQNEGFQNVLIVWSWLCFITVAIAVSAADKEKELKPTIRYKLDVAFDIPVISLMVYFGFFFTAIAYACHTLLIFSFRTLKREPKP